MVSFKETTQARNADTKMFKRGIKFLHKNQKKIILKGAWLYYTLQKQK